VQKDIKILNPKTTSNSKLNAMAKKTKQVSVLCLEGKQMFAQISETKCPERTIFRQISERFILGINPKDPNHQKLFLMNTEEVYCPVGILTLRPEEKHCGICDFRPFYD